MVLTNGNSRSCGPSGYELLEAIPVAVYATDSDGQVTFFNRAAAVLAGREPELGKDRWCVTWRLYRPDGSFLPASECPMAVTLKERRAVRGVQLSAERPDGSRVPVMPFPTLIHDAAGQVVGAVNVLVDISDAKRAEEAVVRRMEQQTALFQFTDRLYRAESVTDIYEAGLDTILVALRCGRASILLFDGSGEMHFVAWRGLSETYRKAVEGHSPWGPDERNPRPFVINDLENAGLPEELKATIEAEGINALAFIPLMAGGRLIGKFMAYSDQSGFSEEDVALALTIARQLGFGLDRKRAEEELRRSEALLRATYDNVQVGICEIDLNGNYQRVNETFCRITGYAREELIGKNFAEITHPDDVHSNRQGIGQLTRGEIQSLNLDKRYIHKDGRTVWASLNASAVRDQAGRPVALLGAVQDITERKQAEEHRVLLVNELNHRVRNTLATVQAIASQTLRDSPLEQGRRQAFEGRIFALARAHGLLTSENWAGANLRDVVLDSLQAFGLEKDRPGRISATGADVWLSPRAAVALVMAFHELATNAAKYGALSSGTGRVEISWNIAADEQAKRLCLVWREFGGPPVSSPARKGFGSQLIERALPRDIGGEVVLLHEPQGVLCRMRMPISGNSLGEIGEHLVGVKSSDPRSPSRDCAAGELEAQP